MIKKRKATFYQYLELMNKFFDKSVAKMMPVHEMLIGSLTEASKYDIINPAKSYATKRKTKRVRSKKNKPSKRVAGPSTRNKSKVRKAPILHNSTTQRKTVARKRSI